MREMLTYERLFSVCWRGGRRAWRPPSVTIRQYDSREFDGPSLVAAIKAHPDNFGMGMGRMVG